LKQTYEIVFLSEETRTGDGDSSPFDLSAYEEGILLWRITEVSGTSPTLSVDFQVASDSEGPWHNHTSLGTKSAVEDVPAVKVSNFGSWAKIKFTLGGTSPSFKFSVIGVFKR